MKSLANKNSNSALGQIGLHKVKSHWNLPPAVLVEMAVQKNQGKLSESGALSIDTGEFTGRSPKDRYIVKDDITSRDVDWGEINQPFSPENFDVLHKKVLAYLDEQEEVYVRDGYACANKDYQLNVRVVAEKPWQSLFVNNMFLRPTAEELANFEPEWTVLAAPGCMAIAKEHGTRQHNFSIINFTKKLIIIGGSAYTGEIKKGIFSVLNFILPKEEKVLSMHCSANVGKNGDTALFFGLSGTGKTTLSADPNRQLIGDDEHGWSKDSVFNFEGGCYAKCIKLSPKGEPQIYKAIKFGALLENINYVPNSRVVNFDNIDKTQNTRVSYPIYHIDNIKEGSQAGTPKNIFFLTCDAFGVLPPISKLTKGQAMYHFLSGYTAKVAGTEAGVNEPQDVFSACFGLPFLPLHPTVYAQMLGEKLDNSPEINVWLVNTGWTGGPSYGKGERIRLQYTRAMITAALEGKLNEVDYEKHPIFGLDMPTTCPNVPDGKLNPRDTWADKDKYDAKANELAQKFNDNFALYIDKASEVTKAAAPKIIEQVH